VVVASAAGFAPDWAECLPKPPGKPGADAPIRLRLQADDTPILGRVVDLEGRPVANCPVDIDRIGRAATSEALDQLIAGYGARPSNSLPKGLSTRDSVAAGAAGLPARVTTDRDGRFRISGVGKDRIVWLTTRGEKVEHAPFHVVTRVLDAKRERNGPFGLFGSTFTLRVAPARPITGTVKDAETGKPVAGMRVAGRWDYDHCEAVSDKDGRYTLFGLPKAPRYDLWVVSAGEARYFERQLVVEDTPGFGPVTAGVPVRRGVVLSGRVTDPAGRPVRGWMFYFPDHDNPNLKDYPGYADQGSALQRTPWGRLDADGRYRVLAVPGPATLGVHATPEARYTQLNKMSAIRSGGLGFPSEALHALGKVDARPDDLKSLVRDFRLAYGTTRTLRLEFPGGRPKTLLALGHPESQSPRPVTADTLTVTGLSPNADRAVIVMDEAKTVGAFVAVRGDAGGPLSVKVDQLASLTGRLLDGNGKPLAGATVVFNLVLNAEKYDNLPGEFFEGQGVMVRGYYTQAWRSFTTRRVTTDDEGRFTVTGLLPGQTYHVWGGYRDGNGNVEITVDGKNVTAPAPGKGQNLGDLKATRN
jgi:protocatechuate 3,4-dioxygenase beta subunit